MPVVTKEHYDTEGARAAVNVNVRRGLGPLPEQPTIEIGLPNGRRLMISASLDPTILARLWPVLDAS
ncbi:hypothetical protein [Ensifer sp. 22564]|uniref:hypothetical protein n=1 Tax=Sinorhizobium/Ensifer group TaxID=227292 RepID=UPI003F82B0CF